MPYKKTIFIGCLSFLILCGFFSKGFAFSFSSASEEANEEADKRMYQERSYQNVGQKGPMVIVLPGQIKSNNAFFLQKITANNIRDFGEMELSKANFRVLERGDLNPMLQEQQLAVQMGSQEAQQFGKGKFKSTRWFVRFDILKAEPVASVQKGFDGAPLGNVAGALIHSNRGSSVARTVGSSVQYRDEADVWIVGMRYKVMDAATSEQVASGYIEKKMEHNANAKAALGFSKAEQKGVTLDTMVQRLVQESVAEMDRMK
jgi:hypothetical protein